MMRLDEEQLETTFDETAYIDDVCFGELPGFHEIPHGLAGAWLRAEPDIYT
jgi:hypothetical protein